MILQVGRYVAAVPYMINNSAEVQDHTQEVIVYPACVVTRGIAKQTKVAATENDREKTQQKIQKEPDQDESNRPQLIRKEKIVKLQEEDADLVHIQERVVSESKAAPTQVRYYRKSGVLIQRWRPLDTQGNETWRAVHQIVIPRPYRIEILCLAHETPLAVHLGINKTYQRVLQHFTGLVL